jgi:hypothetical protein
LSLLDDCNWQPITSEAAEHGRAQLRSLRRVCRAAALESTSRGHHSPASQ